MILSYRLGYSCAKILRDSIEEKTGKKLRVTCYPNRVDKLLIRYGNSSYVDCEDTQYNSAEFINLCSNKLLFASLVLQHNFYAPIFKTTIPLEDDYPLIIRKTMTGFSGRGIVVCRSEDEFIKEWNNSYHWTKFINTNKEYRVQVLGGNIERIFRKEFTGDIEEDLPIRNSYRHYHYALKNKEGKYQKLEELVHNLDPILGGKFYGLDVGWDNERSEYLIFEANSGYGINCNSANVLADYLIKEGVI